MTEARSENQALLLLRTMRPGQWIKNLVVFAGVIFARQLDDPPSVGIAVAAFCVFCGLSSAVYIVNDLADAEHDSRHPLKRHRPLASGTLRRGNAAAAAIVLGVVGLGAAFWLGWAFGLVALSYAIVSLAYSLSLQRVVILDAFCVASGFVLRALGGAVVIEVAISEWLLVCTILLALFLALSKRRHELVLLREEAPAHRDILAHYTPRLLDQMIAVVTSSTVMGYCLYTMWPDTVEKFGTTRLIYTIPFVLFGVFRYLYLVHRRDAGGRPERVLLTDPPLLIDVVCWIVAVLVILYA
ncbi:MAG: decaprenyl-phosphate phosphoribosyltransferase [Armatimonadota bacterium]